MSRPLPLTDAPTAGLDATDLDAIDRLVSLEWERSKQRDKLNIELPALYPAQAKIKRQAGRFNVLDIGRRAGKTYLGVHLATEAAIAGHPVGWFAPSYKYVLEVWTDLTRLLRPIATKINATERRIELPNGGLIEVWTLEKEDAGRSRKYKLAIIDEAAVAPNLKIAWEQAITPTLTDLAGDAWFLSTPKGLNYFYDLFQRGQDPAFPDWRSWQMPSTVNPYLPAAEIELQRATLPELVFKQEYLAEFLQNEGAVFRNVDACLTAPPGRTNEHEGHLIVGGVDWARVHDFTVISLFCCHCRREVYLDRFNQIGWDFQRARLRHAIEAWQPKQVILESNSIGSPNLEALRSVVDAKTALVGFETTYKSKSPLIQALALAFEKEAAAWLPDPVARHELVAYEAKLTETGLIRYGAPEGGWDDTVIARALAWRAARPWIPAPLSEEEILEGFIPAGWKAGDGPEGHSWQREGWEIARAWQVGKAREQMKERYRDLDDAWQPASPFAGTNDDFWKG